MKAATQTRKTTKKTKSTPRPLSWKAVRRGAVYCAPACGAGCTYKAFEAATRAAARLAKRLGPAWTARVWENLGWHYQVTAADGRLRIDEDKRPGKPTFYTASLHYDAGDQGSMWRAHASTPEAAVADVLQVAQARVDAMVVGLSTVRQALA